MRPGPLLARLLVLIFVFSTLLAACSTSDVTGALQVAITGLPDGTDADVRVTGPGETDVRLTESTTLRDLTPGEYRVRASTVSGAEGAYDPSPADATVTVDAGGSARADVEYAPSETFAELQEDAHVLDEESRGALVAYESDGTLRFGESTGQLAALEVGDVLVSDAVEGAAPHGFLRRVTDVRDEGGQRILVTEPATLTELVVRARASAVVDLAEADVQSVRMHHPGITFRAPGDVRASQDDDIEYDYGFEFEEALVETDAFTLTLDGALEFDAALRFDLAIDGTLVPPEAWVERFELGMDFFERARLRLTAEAEVEFEKEIPLATLTLASVTIPAGPVPIVLSVDLTVFLGSDGRFYAVATTAAVQTAELTVGSRYLHGTGWEDLWNTDSAFTFDPPSISGEASLRAFAGARLAAGLYGEAGAAGTLTTRAFIELDAALPRYPLWCFYGGVAASYGYNVSVPVLSVDLADRDVEFAALRDELDCAPNNPPHVTITAPLDGASFEETSTWSYAADAGDIEMAESPSVRWELDGEPLGNLRSICPGDHALTAIARDDVGAESSDTVTVTITNGTPEVSIDEIVPASPGEDNDVRLAGSALDPSCTDLTGAAGIDLEQLVWTLQDGFDGTGAGILSAFTTQGTKSVELTYTDAHGATGSAETTVEVGPNDPSAPPLVVIEAPQDGQRFTLDQATGSTYSVDAVGSASASVDASELVWAYRIAGSDGWTEGGTGTDTTFVLPVPGETGGQDDRYEVWFRVAGAALNDPSSDLIEIVVEGVIQ